MTANPKCSSPIKPLAIGAASIDDSSLTETAKPDGRAYGHPIRQGETAIIDWTPVWREMLADLLDGAAR